MLSVGDKVGENLPKEISMSNRHPVATFGQIVVDVESQTVSPRLSSTAKQDAKITVTTGGAAAHCARVWQNLSIPMAATFVIGSDPVGIMAHAMAMEEFPTARTVPASPRTRLSIKNGDRTVTFRSSLLRQPVSDAALATIRRADVFVLAPLTPDDEPHVRQLLTASQNSILLQSSAQLDDRVLAFQRMNLAKVTVMNDSEARLLTHQSDIVEALRQIQMTTCKTVIVTFETGALAWAGDFWHWQPSFTVSRIHQTIGAGDTFTAAFAVALSMKESIPHALSFGQAAAVRYVEGRHPARRIVDLEDDTFNIPPLAPSAASGRWVLNDIASHLRNPHPAPDTEESSIPGLWLG